jgi:Histidine kinase-, DNA gyrase B-, and HSP90-like ATPase
MSEEDATPNASKFMREVLRGSSYDFSTALADIIDNSIQAGANKIHIDVDFENVFVSVVDNGSGMSDEVHREAMKVASETRDYAAEDLGKYGTGLKAASLSLADRLIVATKTVGSLSPTVRCLDLEHIRKVNDWKRLTLVLGDSDLPDTVRSALAQLESGTAVVWERLSRLFESTSLSKAQMMLELERQLKHAEQHIAMVFHRFLDGSVPRRKPLEIYLNGAQVTPWDPFCRDEKTLKMEVFETLINGSKITLSPYILPTEKEFSSREKFESAAGPKRWNESQGFYVYRNYRLIKWGGWLRMRASEEHKKFARIALDFSSDLDSVLKVNVAKSSLTLPYAVKSRFEDTVRECAAQADKRYRNQKKLASGGLSSLPGRGSSSSQALQRKMTAQQFVGVLEQLAESGELDSALKKIKGALIAQSPRTAKEVGWLD